MLASQPGYGLYWFDGNNKSVKAVEANGTVNTVPLNFYDPSKPTIVHFHGWQPDSATRGDGYDREDFRFVWGSEDVITSSSWKEKGWNIAYFYWDQFADESEVKDAEAKMWSANGPRGMRYRLSDGNPDWTGERVRWTVQELIDRHDIPVTAYYSSNINDLWIGDKNLPLRDKVTEIWNRFWYLADEVNKHNHVVPFYFHSMASAPPEEVTIDWWGNRTATGKDAGSASTDDNRILEMMGDTHYWDQVEGRYTADPEDDQFEIKNY